jgi:hypothetical protein
MLKLSVKADIKGITADLTKYVGGQQLVVDPHHLQIFDQPTLFATTHTFLDHPHFFRRPAPVRAATSRPGNEECALVVHTEITYPRR